MRKNICAFLIIENKSCERLRFTSMYIIPAALIFLAMVGYGRICYRVGAYALSRVALSYEVKRHDRLLEQAEFLNDLVHSAARFQNGEQSGFPADGSVSYSCIMPVSLSVVYDFFDLRRAGEADNFIEAQQKRFKAPLDTFSIEYAHPRSPFIPQGVPSKGHITSHFGARTDPVSEGTAFHWGIDIAQSKGEPVWVTADGKVTFAGKKRYSGNVVEVSHFESGYKTVYAHLQTINVRVGRKVGRGQAIGTVGTTGRSTGPHLHYEVHFQNKPVDPLEFMVDPYVMP